MRLLHHEGSPAEISPGWVLSGFGWLIQCSRLLRLKGAFVLGICEAGGCGWRKLFAGSWPGCWMHKLLAVWGNYPLAVLPKCRCPAAFGGGEGKSETGVLWLQSSVPPHSQMLLDVRMMKLRLQPLPWARCSACSLF